MKKITTVAAIALFAVAFTSCKKDYTCTCKLSDGTVVGTGAYPKAKKKDAKEACDGSQTQLKALGTDATCSL